MMIFTLSAVTPWYVAPPLSAPSGHFGTHGGPWLMRMSNWYSPTQWLMSPPAAAAAVPLATPPAPPEPPSVVAPPALLIGLPAASNVVPAAAVAAPPVRPWLMPACVVESCWP